MLVRRLASGVRSSCEASATSWRCASSELSSAFSIRLKLRASAASSSLPVASIRRLRSRVRRDLLGGATQPLDRGDRGPGHEIAERARQRDPADADQRQDQRQVD